MDTTTMRRSNLIQRLNRPYPSDAPDNPFTFGGGLHNGGLSEDAMALTRGLFSFDYMGAAEFEFGAVPKAFNKIAKAAVAGELVACVAPVDLATVPDDWRTEHTKGYKRSAGEASIYVLCPLDWSLEVVERVRKWAAESYNEDLKESTQLSRSLRPREEWDSRTGGWLELDNGFMFFTNEIMWRGVCNLFGVAHA